ncbi:hypothetical protein [Azospirillum palustre]
MSPCGPERPCGSTRNFAHRLCRNAARDVQDGRERRPHVRPTCTQRCVES